LTASGPLACKIAWSAGPFSYGNLDMQFIFQDTPAPQYIDFGMFLLLTKELNNGVILPAIGMQCTF